MYKLILKTPSFDLMEDVKKNLGVVFHPNTTVSSVETLIKRRSYVKDTPKASSEVRQDHSSRKGFVGKTEKASREKKTDGFQTTHD